MEPNNLEKIYCLAPWTHAFINTRGKRNLCCFRDYSSESVTANDHIPLEDYWNSEEMRYARLEMMKNRAPRDCSPCQEHVFFNDHPRHFFFNDHNIDENIIFENTAADGSTTLKPVFFNYRFSNICQFACRMCDGLSSSRLEKLFADTPTTVESLVRPFLNTQVLPELMSALERGEIDKIYWAGGEPLLATEHWQFMKRAIEINRASEIEVIYNTNLGLLKTSEGNLESLVSHFKHTRILASCDGVEEMGEFIRTGLNWQQFKKNLLILRSLPKVEVVLTITLTLPGLLEIEKLAHFILDHNFSYDVHFASANGPHELFSPLILPRPLLKPLVEDSVDRLRSLNDHRLHSLIKNCEKILTHKTIAEKLGAQFEAEFFVHRDRYLTRERKEKTPEQTLEFIYRKHNKDLLEWWLKEPIIQLTAKELAEQRLQEDWSNCHLQFTSKGRVAYLFKKDHPLLRMYRDQKLTNLDFIPFEKIQDIPNDCYDSFLLTNEWPSQADLEKLKSKLRVYGYLSVIAPVYSPLNSFLNRIDLKAFKNKIEFHRSASAFSLNPLPAFSYIALQRQWPDFIISTLKLFERFIPKRLTSLHGHFFWQKK